VVHADVSLSGNSIHTVKKNTESVLVTSNETALEAHEVLKILSMYSCHVNRMQAKITISRWTVIV